MAAVAAAAVTVRVAVDRGGAVVIRLLALSAPESRCSPSQQHTFAP